MIQMNKAVFGICLRAEDEHIITSNRIQNQLTSHSAILIKLFIIVVMANGLIANFAPSIGVNAGTLCIDAMVIVLSIAAVFKELSGNSKGRSIIPTGYVFLFVAFCLIVAATALSVAIVGYYVPGLLSDLRIRILYFFVAPMVYVLLDQRDSMKVFRFFINCGTVFCLFAIIQSLFADVLDAKFLSVEYDGTLALSWSDETMSATLRSNALMGNAIEFGGVCILLFVCSLCEAFSTGFSLFKVFRIAIIACGCYCTYSRVAFAGMLVLAVFSYLRLGKTQGVNKYLKFAFAAAAIGAALFLLLGESALMDRYLGQDEFTSASNEAHSNNIVKSIEVISENPLFGTGLGTQLVSDERATADGWWFQLAAETGIFVFLLYIYMFVFLAVRSFEVQKKSSGFAETMSVSLFLSLAYFMAVSVVNSSFFGRADLCLFFTLTGCWLSVSSTGFPASPVRKERLSR